MRRFLLSFVTVFVLIPCIAQQTHGQTNLRPLTPCPPFGTLDPVSQTICTGSRVGFVASSGLGSYGAWEMSSDSGITWQPSPGNTVHFNFGDSLIIPVVSESLNGHLFRCVYDSICGDIVFTDYAVLTVADLPININAQPSDVSVCKNYPVDYSVKANGSSVKYQWQVSTNSGIIFTNLPGKTTPLLHFDSAFLYMNNYRYRCVITSDCSPTVISDVALLTVKDETNEIITQPVDRYICMGDTAEFNVGVTGSNIVYQWQRSRRPDTRFEDITGANSSTYTSAEAGWFYRCISKGNCKTLQSHVAQVIYVTPPLPNDAEQKYLCTGEQLFFNAWNGFIPPGSAFQWQVSRDGGATFTNIADIGQGSALLVTAADSTNNFIYRCRLTHNCFDVYSNFKSLKADMPVSIISQPQNTNGCVGFPATFSIKTIGSASQYQWQVSPDGGVTFTDLPTGWNESLNPVLLLAPLTLSQNNYLYRCRVSSNCFDTVYSDVVTLHVFDNPVAPNDTSTEVYCDTCKTNITNLFNTTPYASSTWGNSNPLSSGPGKYKLNVFNTSGCFDSAYAFVNVHDNDTIKICRNSPARFHSNISGTTYQWQIKAWNGFVDITDNNGITGSATADITFQNTSAMQLRCKIDNTNYTNVVHVRVAAFWTGAADNNWNNPLNWNCGEVPWYGDTYVTIMPGSPHLPVVISSDAECKTLTLKPGAELIVNQGYILYIAGGD